MSAVTIGQRLKSQRERSGLTRPALARVLGTTQTTVYRWETGRSAISLTDLLRVADAVGVPVTAFLDGLSADTAQ